MRIIGEAIRCALAGVANTLLSLSIIWALLLINFHFAIANAIGFAAGVALGYCLNRRWTFGARGGRSTILRFLAVLAVCYFFNLMIVFAAVDWMSVNPFWAQAGGMVAYSVAMFAGSKWLVFTDADGVDRRPGMHHGA